MKRKGFILIESIIMFIVLITALLMLYQAANNYMLKERTYENYDDIASIYQAYYVKEALKNYSRIDSMKNSLLTDSGYGRIIGGEISNFFTDASNFYLIAEKLNLYQIYLVGQDITGLKECAKNINSADTNCSKTYLDENLRSYINSINVGVFESDYYLILEFRKNHNGESCASEECISHYTWVSL